MTPKPISRTHEQFICSFCHTVQIRGFVAPGQPRGYEASEKESLICDNCVHAATKLLEKHRSDAA